MGDCQGTQGRWLPNKYVVTQGVFMKLDRITSNPQRMNGQPCIRTLRLTVRRVIELLATYPDREELHQEFPELENEDIRQALIFAASYLDDRIVELPDDYEAVA